MTVEGQAGAAHADVILVGGGLANAMIAWWLAHERPDVRLLVLEQGPVLGGKHTWSFHDTDVTGAALTRLLPMIEARWPAHAVKFPAHTRVIGGGYASVTSERLALVVGAKLGLAVRVNTQVTDVAPTAVTLKTGEVLTAPLVIDGRGALGAQPLVLGFQKFLGLELETARPHDERHPVLMDATLEQLDGYRFMYTLPFSPTRIQLVDTYYSDGPAIDRLTLEARIHAYARAKGWINAKLVRDEVGVLPITLAGNIDEHWRQLGHELPRSGLRAWLFHAATGYSLPYAVKLAAAIAASTDLTSPAIQRLTETMSRETFAAQSFYRLVNRLLFLAARDDGQRRNVLQRFYTLPEPLILRFYAGQTTPADQLRIMSGWPPVSVLRAVGCLSEASAWRQASRLATAPARLG